MQLMFVHTKGTDGLDYVELLPSGHWLYELREWVTYIREFFW